MRVSVIGTSGSGKTTFAEQLAEAAGIRHVDLDAINWQPNWIDLNSTDVAEFRRRVVAAVGAVADDSDDGIGDSWVASGNYGNVQDIVFRRATHLVWLDYPRWLVMARVLRRSFVRAWTGEELWPNTGNRETFSRWLDKGHPIRWAWDTYAGRKQRFEALMAHPSLAHLQRIRLTEPREAAPLIQRLRAEHQNASSKGWP